MSITRLICDVIAERDRAETLRVGLEDGMPTARLDGPDGAAFHAWGADYEDALERLRDLVEAAS